MIDQYDIDKLKKWLHLAKTEGTGAIKIVAGDLPGEYKVTIVGGSKMADINLEKVTIDLFVPKSELPKYHGTEGYKMLVEDILDRYCNDEYFDFEMDALKDLEAAAVGEK